MRRENLDEVAVEQVEFQYRKRYEVTCDDEVQILIDEGVAVSIPQAV